MNILGLDLGTKIGYAYNIGGGFYCGTWALATPAEIRAAGKDRSNRRNDPRTRKLCELLSGLPEFDVVVFEDVQFASSTYQVQLWAGLRSAVNLCAHAKYFDCVPVQTLKKFAACGNATKTIMGDALKQKHPEIWDPNLGEDAIDAAWVWLWAKQNLSRMKL